MRCCEMPVTPALQLGRDTITLPFSQQDLPQPEHDSGDFAGDPISDLRVLPDPVTHWAACDARTVASWRVLYERFALLTPVNEVVAFQFFLRDFLFSESENWRRNTPSVCERAASRSRIPCPQGRRVHVQPEQWNAATSAVEPSRLAEGRQTSTSSCSPAGRISCGTPPRS